MNASSSAPDNISDAVFSGIIMNIGADETQRNLTWYSQYNTAGEVRYAKSENGELPAEYFTAKATVSKVSKDGYYSYKATMTGLEENSTYVYRLVVGDIVSKCYTCSIYGTGNEFSFAFVTDTQTQKESQANRWNDTLNQLKTKFDGVSFLVSAGDQINNAAKEEDYDYFASSHLSSIAIATSVGPPHDNSPLYSEHFNLPNLSEEYGKSITSSDYFYTYGNVLFMHLNVENRNHDEHIRFMEKVIAGNSECTWRVVVLHYSFFTGGKHSVAKEVLGFREAIADDFSRLDIDVVLSGHDHLYSRSKLMTDGKTVSDDTVVDNSVTDPLGTLYLCGTPSAGGNYNDVTHSNDDVYIAYRSKSEDKNRKSVVIFHVSETALGFKAYFIDNYRPELFDSFTISKHPNVAEHIANDEWQSKNGKHWQMCAVSGCAEILNEGECSLSDAACESKSACNICGAEYGELAGHVPSDEWHFDSLVHWKECKKCGAKLDEAEHTFNETDDGKDTCVCGCVVPSQKTNGVAVTAAVLGGIAAAGAAGAAALSLVNKKKSVQAPKEGSRQ